MFVNIVIALDICLCAYVIYRAVQEFKSGK
jgi:hypothetical protein